MDNEKNFGFDSQPTNPESNDSASGGGGNAPRARNRTVMLTPEVTGQVRARLAQDIDPVAAGHPSTQSSSGFSGLNEAGHSESGFIPAVSRARGGFESSDNRPRTPQASLPAMATHQPVVVADSGKAGVVWSKKTPVVGFLVSFDSNQNGDIYELRSGRVIVTSEISGQGNFFVVPDETVSPMHAILRVSAGGEVQVLDQLSEHGTKIKKFGSEEETELSGEKGSLEHGDIVRFGKRNFHVCIIQLANGA